MIITGTDNPETLQGTSGDDTIAAGGGDDRIIATTGTDSVDGEGGIDTLAVHYRDLGLFPSFPAGQVFTITGTNVRDSTATLNTNIAGIERIEFNTNIVSGGGTRAQAALTIDGSAATADLILTGGGFGTSNILTGGSGNDVFNIGDGTGTIDGNGGSDTVSLADAFSFYTFTDRAGGGVTVSSFDFSRGIVDVEYIVVRGTLLTATQSTFSGFIFWDDVRTQNIQGAAGNDRFLTATGAGGGNDVYHGNGGNDVFDFHDALASIGNKTIADLDGNDRLDFSGGSAAFIGTGAFTGVAGQYRYQSGSGQTVIQVDADGNGVADQTITITNRAYQLAETSPGSNILRVDNAPADIDGTSGPDSLIGTGGDDNIRAYAGNDDIRATAGADWVDGGSGTDRLIVEIGGAGAFPATGTSQTYMLSGTAVNNAAIGLATTLVNVETIVIDTIQAGGAGDHIDATAGTVALDLRLGAGADDVDGSTRDDRIDGGGGDDVIDGGGGTDIIFGGLGSDTLTGESVDGGADNDVVTGTTAYGGAGADTIFGTANSDDLYSAAGAIDAGAEKDVLFGGDGFDEIYAGVGDDVDGGQNEDTLSLSLLGAASGVTVNTALFSTGAGTVVAGGTIRNIEIVSEVRGSNFDDRIAIGGQANPTQTFVYGFGGDDILTINNSRVFFDGGDGDDRFIWSPTSMGFSGGNGVDTIDFRNATSGVNQVLGNTVENADGSAFGDTLNGNTQGSDISMNNKLQGFDGDDTLNGGVGNDILVGGAGADMLNGGTGDDIFIAETADTIVDALGYDSIQAAATFRLNGTAAIEFIAATDRAGTAPIDLAGNGTGQTIFGNAGVNTLEGLGGDDILFGLAGVDRLEGGTGGDTLDGGDGSDVMIGGADNDIYAIETAGDVVVEAVGEGNDRVLAYASYALTLGAEVELLSAALQNGSDPLNLSGNEFAQAVIGNEGTNTLAGLGGNDTLYGLGGADSLDGGSGNDTMLGGTGNDSYNVDAAGDTVIEAAGEGSDRVLATASYRLAAGAEVELLSAADQNGTQAIDLAGNEVAQSVIGNEGANILEGLGGGDTLYGLGGDDLLDGGAGSDVLIGGTGADQFRFSTALGADNVDTILGFTVGSDRILLDDAVFGALSAGTLPASAFVNGTAAQDGDDRIVYDSASGTIWYDADGNGSAAATAFAHVDPGTALTADVFTVI